MKKNEAENMLVYPACVGLPELWHVRPFIGLFYRENSRKCEICRNPKLLRVVPSIGHISSLNFFGVI